jgi:hypothetical protein
MFADKLSSQDYNKVMNIFNVFSLKQHKKPLTDNQFKVAFEFIVNQNMVYTPDIESQIKTVIYDWTKFEETVSGVLVVDLPGVLVDYNTKYGVYYPSKYEEQSPFYSQLLDVYKLITRMKREQKYNK